MTPSKQPDERDLLPLKLAVEVGYPAEVPRMEMMREDPDLAGEFLMEISIFIGEMPGVTPECLRLFRSLLDAFELSRADRASFLSLAQLPTRL